MGEKTEVKQNHYLHMDVLRIIACLMVVFNHTNERGFMRLSSDELGSASFFLDTFMSTVCKAGVPLFFMMSGALLLGREESLSRIIRILVDLIVFSLLYFWIDTKLVGQEFSLSSTLKMMISSNYWHLWYLYAYIVFVISLPVLRKLVKGMDESGAKYLFVLAFVYMAVYPILKVFLPSPPVPTISRVL